MLATALFAAAGVAAVVALKCDQLRIRRLLEAQVVALQTRLDAAELQAARVWARQDRLQNMASNEGWRDSRLMTTFDWRKPTKF